VAKISPLRATSREGQGQVQGQNAKPPRNAGVVDTAESGCLSQIGALESTEYRP
jgi:hypothetical protein